MYRHAILLTTIMSSACASSVEVDRSEPLVDGVDLSLVQRVDSEDLADGDEQAFAHADHSDALLHGRKPSSTGISGRRGACSTDPRVLLGLVSFDTCVGADLFFREAFGGNGRTCGSCHPVTNNYTIDPRFIESVPSKDPLFVAETNPALAELEHPDLLRSFGLFVVNADGFEAPTEKFVMRSVSHTLSLATSIKAGPPRGENGLAPDFTTVPPVERTGWSGDGAPGNGALLDFATGAVMQHATRSLDRVPYADFLLPTETQLHQIREFELGLGRKNELDLLEVHLSDPLAERGRRNFLFGPARACEDCHREAGANSIVTPGLPDLHNASVDLGTERDRISLLNDLGIPFDGGFGLEPFDANGDGVPDSFGNGRFNSQPLIEAADTGPFFHTNAAETIEDAIRFYTTDAFGNSPVGQDPSPVMEPGPFKLTEPMITELGRFLRVLNASFNCQLALTRLQAALQITDAFGNRYISIQRGLLDLADVELRDAMRVLSEVDGLNVDAQAQITGAQDHLTKAHKSLFKQARYDATRAALLAVVEANASLGDGVHFVMGEGNLMF